MGVDFFPDLTEVGDLIGLNFPVDINGAGIVGDWVNMSEVEALHLVEFHGVIGATFNITLEQATDNAGTGAKTLSFTEIKRRTTGAFETVTVTGDSHPVGTTANQMNVVTIRHSDLDANNSFSHVRLNGSDPGAGTLAAVLAAVSGRRYQGATPPSIL